VYVVGAAPVAVCVSEPTDVPYATLAPAAHAVAHDTRICAGVSA
jgi:hypothetical protein